MIRLLHIDQGAFNDDVAWLHVTVTQRPTPGVRRRVGGHSWHRPAMLLNLACGSQS
jgi:hypothetical protein